MAVKCPNRNTPEWKKLVKITGSDAESYRLWLANGEEIPSLEQLVDEGLIEAKTEKPRFQTIIDNLQQKKSLLYKRISSKRAELKDKSGEEKLKLNKEVSYLEKQVEETDTKIGELSKSQVLEDSLKFAQQDIEEVGKILDKKDISLSDLTNIKRPIRLWMAAGDFKEGHIFFDENELKQIQDPKNTLMYPIGEELKRYQAKAEGLWNKWLQIAQSKIEDKVKEKWGEDANVDYKALLTDVGKLTSLTLDISETDNILAKSMFVWNKEASFETHKEAKYVFDGLDDVFKEIGKSYSKKDINELFAQRASNTDNRKTGDLTYRYTQAYFDWNKARSRNFKKELNLADEIADPEERRKQKNKLIRDYITETKKYSLMLDARKLFPNKDLYENSFSDSDIQNHRQELITNLGQKGYKFYLEAAEKQLKQFKDDRDVFISQLDDDLLEDAAKEIKIREYDAKFSPYLVAENFFEGTIQKVAGDYITPSNRYTKTVPRRIVNGKNTEFYDKNFEKIENNDKLLALYNYIIDTLHEVNSYLPSDMTEEFQVNTLPFMEKTLIEQYTQNGMSGGLTPIWDLWKESIRTKGSVTTESSEKRDVEGERERELRVRYITNIDKIIKDYIFRKSLELKQQTGNTPTVEQIQEWTREIKDQVANERSNDLEKLVKAYSLMAIGFKHKAKIEDAMSITQGIINNALEQETNNAGEVINDQYGDPISKKGLNNFKDSVEYFMKKFYGEAMHKVELKFGKKVYTSKEQKVREEIEALKAQNIKDFDEHNITKKEFLQIDRKLEKQLSELGGVKAGSKIGDQLNMWVRLKGLGWNFFSPIMNSTVGYVNNLIEGSDGRRFNNAQLHKGYNLTLSQMNKVRHLMDRYDTLKELQNEIYVSERVKKGINWLAPFTLQSRSEYLNQAPVMIAMLLNTKVKLNGKDISLFEAYNDNGELLNGVEMPSNLEANTKLKIDKVIKDIHGNYDPDSPIPANSTILGRSLLVFRKWMINAYYTRLGQMDAGKVNPISGIEQKGRWRSYGQFFDRYGYFGGVFNGTLQLLRKIAFQKTNLSRLDDVDAANMRANLTEIMSMIAVTALALLIKGVILNDDDDESDIKYLSFFWINQLNRMQMDIDFYIDPIQFKTILRDPLPMAKVITDTEKVLARATTLITGGDDMYHQGIYKDQSKTWVAIKNWFPLTNTTARIQSLTQQIINK